MSDQNVMSKPLFKLAHLQVNRNTKRCNFRATLKTERNQNHSKLPSPIVERGGILAQVNPTNPTDIPASKRSSSPTLQVSGLEHLCEFPHSGFVYRPPSRRAIH